MNHSIPANHFSKKTLRALNKKGMFIIGMTAIPDSTGSFLNSSTGYEINDNGTSRIRSFLDVLKLAATN